MERFTRDIARGTAREIVGANHFLLERHADEIERAMRELWSA
jgi:hypothetical protein